MPLIHHKNPGIVEGNSPDSPAKCMYVKGLNTKDLRYTPRDGIKNLVSVIIPTFNRYHFLKESINSVLNQTYKNIEIIVVDDASTDKNYLLLSQQYPTVKFITLSQNQRSKYNVSSAIGMTRNHGIIQSQGEWLSFIDDDDLWAPQKLETQMNVLLSHPEYKMCSTNMVVGQRGRGFSKDNVIFHSPIGTLVGGINKIDRAMILEQTLIVNISVTVHRDIINKIGLQKLVPFEDYWYWLEATEHTSCIYLHQPLVYADFNNHKHHNEKSWSECHDGIF